MRRSSCFCLPVVLLVMVPHCGFGQDTVPCMFNSMCTCRLDEKSSLRDVSCLGVPFSRLPVLPGGQMSHVDVVGSGLESLDVALAGQIEAFRLITNNIIHMANNTFTKMSKSLRSLDLSHNQLQALPINEFCNLTSLNWLNLHGNQIAYLPSKWCGLQSSLTSLFLGKNDIYDLDLSLRNLTRLEWLTLDHNKIRSVPRGSIPESLHTLSIQNNLLTEIPVRSLDQLPNIIRIYLQSNSITRVPSYVFKTKKYFDKLDLGFNKITEIPSSWFNSSRTIRDLNLEFNNIRALKENAFRSLNSGRIVLANNRIKSIDRKAFGGLEDFLEYLDLEGNLISNLSQSLSKLRITKYLYLSNNDLNSLSKSDFTNFANNLKALSLAGNNFRFIPKLALNGCNQLSHLNLGYNHISKVQAKDFQDWGTHLDTVLLMNNRIRLLSQNLFQFSPRLRELSLSFNKLSLLESTAFVNLTKSLESLELSFCSLGEDFPEEVLRPLSSLLWLALDNNNIRHVARTSLYTFDNLQYLNLDFNRINHIPEGLFNPMINRHLRDLRLSYNRIHKIETESFYFLPNLQSVMLSGNRIKYVEQKAFKDLQSVSTIILSDNNIVRVSLQAFYNLPQLTRLDLQMNDMKFFTFDSFLNTSIALPLALNLSYNKISELICSYRKAFIKIQLLDLSFNEIQDFSFEVLLIIGGYLRKLYLGNNKIELSVLSPFRNMTHLQVLSLERNYITTIDRHTFIALVNLQILNLSFNRIKHIHPGAFITLKSLRLLIMRNNLIKSLPVGLLHGTVLENLDLSSNYISTVPDLEEVKTTIRNLDLSFNAIDYLTNSTFIKVPFLTTLNLCSNRLTILPNDVFKGLNNLLNLRLCLNPLRGNFRQILKLTPNLRRLDMSSVSLVSVPPIEVPFLVELNLTNNLIQDFSPGSSDGLPRLRRLLLGANHLTVIPQQALYRLHLLKELDLSVNPIKVITNYSFSGLRRLEVLSLTDLPDLERVDPGSFSGLQSLSSLSVQS